MFEGREEAALKLAKKLKESFLGEDTLVLALAKGGVVIGKIIATYFNLPLDILVLKKIGVPDNRELAIGVVGPKNTVVWNEDILSSLDLKKKEKEKLKEIKAKEREEQENVLRSGKIASKIRDRVIVLVDDGVATGATVICAREYLKKEKAKKVILAIPVISIDTLNSINKYFDRVIFVKKVREFFAVGQFYRDFPQITNEEVIDIIGKI